MTLDEAKTLIFKRLCFEYKLRGEEARVQWKALPQELGIAEDVFGEAVKGLRDAHIIEMMLPAHMRLASLGRERCKQGTEI